MKIRKSTESHYAILYLNGEFDTFHVPKLIEEVDQCIGAGIYHIALDLRLVEFINSTALGALLKAQKKTKERGGDLIICRPSVFCYEILVRVGLDRLIRVFSTEEASVEYLEEIAGSKTAPQNLKAGEENPAELQDESSILIALKDSKKLETLGGHIAGKVQDLRIDSLDLVWNAEKSGLRGEQLQTLFSPGTEMRLKFRIPLFKKGFFENLAVIESSRVHKDGEVQITAKFGQMSSPDRKAIEQFLEDIQYLKTELKEATSKTPKRRP